MSAALEWIREVQDSDWIWLSALAIAVPMAFVGLGYFFGTRGGRARHRY